MDTIKKKLHQLCTDYVHARMNAAQDAIAASIQAGNDDTKSSAGDKYETGREMMQQETTRNIAQLNEANKLMVVLNQLNINGRSEKSIPGSLVITTNGTFYLSISAGILPLDGENYYAVSPSSPIGYQLIGLQAGDEFTLKGQKYTIHKVF